MKDDAILTFSDPAGISPDPLTDVLRKGARESLAQAREIIEDWRIDCNTERPHSSPKHQTPEEFFDASPFDKTQWAQPLELFEGPRLRSLLTPPNDGKQKENKLYLRAALPKGQVTRIRERISSIKPT